MPDSSVGSASFIRMGWPNRCSFMRSPSRWPIRPHLALAGAFGQANGRHVRSRGRHGRRRRPSGRTGIHASRARTMASRPQAGRARAGIQELFHHRPPVAKTCDLGLRTQSPAIKVVGQLRQLLDLRLLGQVTASEARVRSIQGHDSHLRSRNLLSMGAGRGLRGYWGRLWMTSGLAELPVGFETRAARPQTVSRLCGELNAKEVYQNLRDL